ncbi:enoyl-CoA hydratase/isomerase family protein [Nereida ignava]|uniref:Putative enoyl-CoA hydratase echA6 n=1 Tax=Nereida ignava TaxID=282199 RepID=A0A0U1NLA9_9RHOB|nr:enoyl-CoA hydratase/isomerase family protein [Nereida ignava]CRK75289.1 putative enoyl-CoA hydratase echA6 [Nereida ignava]SFJ71304.1 Enoyl-CoA hydratase/carnithine racemase [Nereida ignava DSM 16309]
MIRLDKDNGLWTITLARPDKANALTYDMLAEIVDIAESAQDARALVLTGQGKVFSAGADLDAAKEGLATSDVWDRASSAIAKLPCMTIAALNGTLAGGAFGIALACDLRVSVPAANFFYPVMRLGYLPQHADPARMVALMGPARTKLILMAGQKIDAETALQFGLIDRISTDPVAEAKALVAHALEASEEHAHAIKRMCQGG